VIDISNDFLFLLIYIFFLSNTTKMAKFDCKCERDGNLCWITLEPNNIQLNDVSLLLMRSLNAGKCSFHSRNVDCLGQKMRNIWFWSQGARIRTVFCKAWC